MAKTSAPDEEPAVRHVLLVEDDAILCLTIEQALRDAGVKEIDICTTTEQALEALRRKQPDAIVLDVRLADRNDGWAVAELVRTLGPDRPRIIFSTGQPDVIPEDVAALGRVLAKPYDAATLVQMLREPGRKGLFSRIRGALG